MNGAEIITFFETLVKDEELDIVAKYQLLNQADAQIRMWRPWEILKSVDSTKSRSAGEDYTNTKSLPSSFHRPLRLKVGTGHRPLKRVKFENLLEYKDVAGIYAIDFKNAVYAITGTTWTGTIYFWHFYKPDAIDADSEPVFPDDYHPIYAYHMAEIWMGGIDQDERSLAAVPQWVKQYAVLKMAMFDWDDELKQNDVMSQSYADEELPDLELGRLLPS